MSIAGTPGKKNTSEKLEKTSNLFLISESVNIRTANCTMEHRLVDKIFIYHNAQCEMYKCS